MKLNEKTNNWLYESPLCESVRLCSEGSFLTSSVAQTTGAEDYTVVDDSSNWN